jgi:TP901 family phage tail tape measure protein
MAAADTARLIAELVLKDKQFQVAIAKAVKSTQTLEKRFDKLGSIAGRGLSSAVRNTERAFVGLGAAAVGAIAGSLKVAGDFEAQLNTINTIARETPEGLKGIGDQIRAIARETGTPLEDLTQGYYDLLSAGIKAADAQKVLTAANQLAIGGLASTAESVDLLTTAINTYGGDATQAARYADIFAKSVERGKVTAAELAESFAQVGPVAAASGIEIEELGAAYARLTASGVPAAEAATQVRSAIVALTRRTSDLEKLEKATGKSYLKIAGKKGLVEALNQLRTDAKKAGVPLIDLLGRVEGLSFTLATTGPNFAAYNADLAAMGDATGTAAGQMAERQQGLNFQLARLKSLAKDAGITIGSKLLPKIVPLFDKLAQFINAHQGDIEKLGDELAKGLEGAAKWAGEVDWRTLGEGLKIGAASAKLLIDAFLKAPAWLQGFLITGFAANKFTGGAIGGIIGELGKGLIKGVLGINAGVVNVNGPVAGGVGGVAGGTSKVGKAVSAIGKVVLIGAAVGAIVELKQLLDEQTAANKQLIAGFGQQTKTFAKDASLGDLETSIKGVGDQMAKLNADLTPEAIAYQLDIDGVKTAIFNSRQELVKAIDREQARLYGVTNNVAVKVAQAGVNAVAQGQRLATAMAAVQSATRTAGANSVAAIRAKRWLLSVKINQTNRFSIRDYVVKTSQTNAYGPVAS